MKAMQNKCILRDQFAKVVAVEGHLAMQGIVLNSKLQDDYKVYMCE